MKNIKHIPYQSELVLKQRGETNCILLNIENNKYYTLEGIGNRIWELCDGVKTVSDIVSIISHDYEDEISFEDVKSDTVEFLDELAEGNIIYFKG